MDYLRAREYDPGTGQFLQVDPALDVTRQAYAYVGNNPLAATDPLGLCDQSDAGCRVFGDLSDPGDNLNNLSHGFFDTLTWSPLIGSLLGDPTWSFTRGLREGLPGVFGCTSSNAFYTYGSLAAGAAAGGAGELGEAGIAGSAAARSGSALEATSTSRAVASAITRSGHAWERHSSDFIAHGIENPDQLSQRIESVVLSGSRRELVRGRTAWFDDESGLIVISDPLTPNGGSAFYPTRGYEYFKRLD